MGLPTWVNNGTAQLLTTAAAVPHPASLSTSNVLILVASSDASLAGLSTPSGWTSLGTQVSGGGMNIRAWWRQAPASDPGDIILSGVTGGTKGIAMMLQYASSGSPITGVTAQLLADSDTSSSTFAASGSSWTTATNDRLGVFMCALAPSGSYSGSTPASQALTSAGSTLGTSTQRLGARASSNTLNYLVRDVDVTAGGTGAPAWTCAPVGANAAGVMVIFKITEVAANEDPTADAGDDQSVLPWETVTLDASDSTDSDGTITAYAWTQTAGTPTVTLSGTGATRTFTAPSVLGGTALTFQVQVTDDDGATDTDTCTVTVASGDLFFYTSDGWKAARLDAL